MVDELCATSGNTEAAAGNRAHGPVAGWPVAGGNARNRLMRARERTAFARVIRVYAGRRPLHAQHGAVQPRRLLVSRTRRATQSAHKDLRACHYRHMRQEIPRWKAAPPGLERTRRREPPAASASTESCVAQMAYCSRAHTTHGRSRHDQASASRAQLAPPTSPSSDSLSISSISRLRTLSSASRTRSCIRLT